MKDVNSSNFGLLIAYLLPGFVAIVGISFFSETVRAWLTVSPSVAPAVGGFLYVTLGSLAVGLTVSTVRWAVIDTIHHRTGIPKGLWNYAILQEKLSAYQVVVTNQYRYYQWYSNMVVSIAVTFTAFCIATGWPSLWAVSVVVGLETVFWLGSRDTLRNYYCRLAMLLGETTADSELSIAEVSEWAFAPKETEKQLKLSRPFGYTDRCQAGVGPVNGNQRTEGERVRMTGGIQPLEQLN